MEDRLRGSGRGGAMKRLLIFLLLLTQPAAAQSGPTEYSGMARFGEQALLVVSDAKADSPASRVGVLTVAGGRPFMQAVTVDDWQGDAPNDLEACCPVPGTSDEFFLAESGWWKGRYGRVFRLRLSHDPARGWVGTVLSRFRPFPAPADGSTDSAEQVEGLAAFPTDAGPVIVLGARGGKGQPSRLVWGRQAGTEFQKLGEQEFSLEELVPGARSCADLQLVSKPEGWQVLTVAATDPGDLGPFRSAVVLVGMLRSRGSSVWLVTGGTPVLAELDGLKVEALAPTPKGIEGSTFCIGTDDEVYGGLWRPLPES